ncbi:MAG TPA: type II secretion system major pseudopilin GspG [Longimicrobiales bacterium]
MTRTNRTTMTRATRCRPIRSPAPAPAARPGGPTRSPRRCRRSGLTLIEMLVVIVVISVLATLVAPNVFRHVGSAKDATARSQIEMLSAALDAYRLDNGRYPTTEQGLAALWEEPFTEPRPTNWRGPYLRKRVPLDPWGRPYIYPSPGEESGMGFDLLSYGADGHAGGTGEDADVKSWE